MTPPKISYTRPSITELEVSYATEAVRTGWGPKCYDYIYRFEDQFRAFTGTRFAAATSSCTGALHLGLAALGIGAGDEVIIADVNWIASAAPVVHLGATPVFVDILADTWCLDPARVEAAITPRTKAVIAVHLYGNLCDLDRLAEICNRHKLTLVEDAAEAIGSQWRGKQVGSVGRFATFSFHGTKTITTGEGGMLVTNDQALHSMVQALNNHGRLPGQSKQFFPEVVGYKYRLSNVQAAIGCAQMERRDELIAGKRRVFQFYAEALKGLRHITLNPEAPGTVNGYWMPSAVFSKESGVTQEQMLKAFAAAGIDARVFFCPLSSLPMFKAKPENRVSYDLPARAINLPSYSDMTEADQLRVVDVLKKLHP